MKRARSSASVIPLSVLESLARLQDGLNCFISTNWRTVRCPDDWGLAVTMESTELIDSFPWKWWKNTKASPDIKNVKIELVDILHFTLSGMMQCGGQELRGIPADIDATVATPLTETKNAVSTFRNVIYLARLHRFDAITQMVIAAADDLDFNLVAYYVAKHTLNYIRQLGGYKDGTYVKVREGQEDNELLHQCIVGVTFEEAVADGASGEACWNAIMKSVYDSFAVAESDRRVVADWVAKQSTTA